MNTFEKPKLISKLEVIYIVVVEEAILNVKTGSRGQGDGSMEKKFVDQVLGSEYGPQAPASKQS